MQVQQATDAIKQLNNKLVDGRKIQVRRKVSQKSSLDL